MHAPGRADVEHINEDSRHPRYGEFRARCHCDDLGLPIKAHSCVRTDATDLAARTIGAMLRGVPKDIRRRLKDAGAAYAVVGKDQVTSDIPGFQYMKYDVKPDGAAPFTLRAAAPARCDGAACAPPRLRCTRGRCGC